MRAVHRVVEDQARVSSFQATQDVEKAIQLEILIDFTKPPIREADWDDLVSTPFRYDLPVLPTYQARFRPPYHSKNVFYGSEALATALFEYSYHLMRQRIHLQSGKRRVKNETGVRTGFEVESDDSHAVRIHKHPDVSKIMDKSDYSASHEFIRSSPDTTYLIYPSVRDPKKRDNMAIMDIKLLAEKPLGERQLNFFYDYRKKAVFWIELGLFILWKQVC